MVKQLKFASSNCPLHYFAFMSNHRLLIFLYTSIILFLFGSCSKATHEFDVKPNVIIIYTDDVGYGDIQAMGGKIPTPHIDGLINNGLLLTNAYATAATCTPSRYALLTGEYAWRARGRGVAAGDAVALIRPERETLPKVFKKAGYTTGVIGKWHLGLGEGNGPNWNGKISPGPLEIGFDYSFLIPATGDRVPTVFVENHHVVNLDPNDPIAVSYKDKIGEQPTGKENPELLTTMWSHGHDQTIVNGISRIGYMKGGESALWRDEDIADQLLTKAYTFIDENQKNPFFMYFATHDIHVPRIAHERFQGTTEFGPRGDVLVQLDYTVGALIAHLKEKGLFDNTMIIFSSDNGPVLDDGYVDGAKEKVGDHRPAGPLRGGKYSAFEAGTKVPLIVHWPGKVATGRSSALFSQVDLLASFAALYDVQYDHQMAKDSEPLLDVLLGKSETGRKGLVQEAIQNVLSYVSSDGFKYIPAHQGPSIVPWGTEIETGFLPEGQLFNLNDDPAETTNLANQNPQKVQELDSALKLVKEGLAK